MAIIMGFKEKTNLITKFFNLPFHSAVLQNILLSRLWLEDNIESEGFESSFGLINLEIWNFISGSKLPFPTHIWPSPGNWMMPSSLLRCSLLLMGLTLTTTLMLSPSMSEADPWNVDIQLWTLLSVPILWYNEMNIHLFAVQNVNFPLIFGQKKVRQTKYNK